MFREGIKQKIEQELLRGEAARSAGYEGRARVCARRAAGEAVRAFLAHFDLPVRSSSAYDLLNELKKVPGVSAEILAAVDRLTTRVDEAFTIPGDVDLLMDARWLSHELEALTGVDDFTEKRSGTDE